METISATITWRPDKGIFVIYREPMGYNFTADPLDNPLASILLELDDERETDRVVGMEIVGGLEFRDWDMIPDLGALWQLPGSDAKPLKELLMRKQAEYRERREIAIA